MVTAFSSCDDHLILSIIEELDIGDDNNTISKEKKKKKKKKKESTLYFQEGKEEEKHQYCFQNY